MTAHPSGRGRPLLRTAALSAAVLLAGCAGAEPAAVQHRGGDSERSDSERGEGGHAAAAAAATALPSAHVHGVAVDPADGRVHLATHDGLFRYEETGPVRVGPVIDLMGFTVAGPDHFYASGHPGPGVDLPDPVGLIESTDGGRTWQVLSRQGHSDFHALAASDAGVVGFDGALRSSPDGTTWHVLDAPVEPHDLAASPDGAVLIGTSETGPVRSTDAGRTWSAIEEAPLLQLVDFAGGTTVVGVSPDGTVALSTDAGATWSTRGRVPGAPQAVGADLQPDGTARLLVVTDAGVHDSRDDGVSFTPLPA
ncbi:F510_1955 family glycosylhydrolase [Kineococcus arenarius]|uniref:F510_1955 family glycosylhydrolase n=1 Tax=Kineococcus sp. SYSU DK007 TaxID=3383128 RepID=UPI003D7E6223